MIEESVEEVALARGEECTINFIRLCNKVNDTEKIDDPNMIALMGLTLLAFWYTGKDEMSEEEIYEYKQFLRDVLAYTYKHQKILQTLN